MPELPEVETIRRELDREVVGKRVKSVDVPGRGAVTRLPKKQFVGRLEGAKVSGGEPLATAAPRLKRSSANRIASVSIQREICTSPTCAINACARST